jgi:TP901 family phage tail tape measure protein
MGIEFLLGANLAPLAAALQQAEAGADKAASKFDEMNTRITKGADASAAAQEKAAERAAAAAEKASERAAAAAERAAERATVAQERANERATVAKEKAAERDAALAARGEEAIQASEIRIYEAKVIAADKAAAAQQIAAEKAAAASIAAAEKAAIAEAAAAEKAAKAQVVAAETVMAANERAATLNAKAVQANARAAADSSAAMGATIAALGLGLAYRGLSADIMECVTTFGHFQATLNQVRAVTDASAEQMHALQLEAIKMGQVTQYSANEAAQGMVRMAKDGFDTTQIIQALPAVLALAAASNTSVDQTARIAAGSLRTFGLEASQMGMVADVMAKAVNASGMSLEDMGQAIKVVGPIAESTGQSFLVMSTELALLGKNMLTGGAAANGLQAILTRLAAPPKDCATALEKLKISVVDTNGAMLPLNMIVDQLRQKTENMTNAQKAAVLSHISGRYALKDLLDLVNAAPDAYGLMQTKLTEQGAATRIAQTMMEGYTGSLKLATSSIETAQKTLGEQLAPAAVVAAKAVQELADFVSALDPQALALAGSLAVAGAAFLGLSATAVGVMGVYVLLSGAASSTAARIAGAAAQTAAAAAAEAEAFSLASAVAVAAVEAKGAAAAAAAASFTAGSAAIEIAVAEEAAAVVAASAAEVAAKEAAAAAAVAAAEVEAAAAVTGAAALGVMLAPLLPIALGLGVVAVALGVVTYEIGQNSAATAVAHRAELEATAGRAKAIETAQNHAAELSRLTEEHDKLIDKVKLTKGEEERLHAIIAQLSKDFPELKGTIDNAANAHLASLPAIAAHTAQLRADELQIRRNIEAETQLAAATFNKAFAKSKAAHIAADHWREQSGPFAAFRPEVWGSEQAAKDADAEAVNALDALEKTRRLNRAMAPKAIFDRFPTAPTAGAAFVGDHKNNKKKGKKGRDPSASQAEKKLAEERARTQEALNQKLYAGALAETEHEIALLERKKQAGLVDGQEFLDQMQVLKSREIDLNSAAAQTKIDAQAHAVEAEIAAAQSAADKGSAIKGAAGAKLRQVELDKVREGQAKLDTLAEQSAGLEAKRQAQQGKLSDDTTTRKIANARQTAAAEDAANTQLIQKTLVDEQTLAELQAKHEALTMDFFTARAESSQRFYAKQASDEQQAYETELRAIASSKAAQWVKDGAIEAADALHIANQRAIADASEKAALRAKTAWLGSTKEVTDAFASLLSSPDLSKIGDLANNIALNPKKFDEWGSAIAHAGENLSTMGTSLNTVASGAALSLDGIAGLAAGVGTLAGGVGIVLALADALQKVAVWAVGDSLKVYDALQGIEAQLHNVQSSADAGLLTGFDADQQRLSAMKAGLGELLKLRDSFVAPVDSSPGSVGSLWAAIVDNFRQSLGLPGASQNRANADKAIGNTQSQIGTMQVKLTTDTLTSDLALVSEKVKENLLTPADALKANASAYSTALNSLAGQMVATSDGAVKATIQKAIATLTPEATKAGAFNGAAGDSAKAATIDSQLANIDTLTALGIAADGSSRKVRLLSTEVERLVALHQKDIDNGDSEGAKAVGNEIDRVVALYKQQLALQGDIKTDLKDIKTLKAELVTSEKALASAQALKAKDSQEYNFGGRDDYGNKISLEAQARNKANDLETAFQERRTAEMDKQKKLREDIAKIDQDERDAVAGVMNQGIAIRQKTEMQDKVDQITKIHNEARVKRDAANEQIAAIDTQIEKDRLSTAKAISNVRILAGEKIQALSDEIAKQRDIIANENEIIRLKRQEIALAASSNAVSTPGYSGGDPWSPANVAGYFAANTPAPAPSAGTGSSGMASYNTAYLASVSSGQYATGGYVRGGIKGVDSVPITAQDGEYVLDTTLSAKLMAYLTAPMPVPSSADLLAVARASNGGGAGQAGTVNFGGITINVTSDVAHNPRELARQVLAEAGALVRQRAGIYI